MLAALAPTPALVKDRGIYLGWGRSPDDGQYTRIGYKGPKHLLGFGPSGSGKSLALCVPALATQRRSMVVIDPKGQLAAISARHRAKMGRVVVLNPYGLHLENYPYLKSARWNSLWQLNPESLDFESDAKSVAEAIINRSGNSTAKDEYFASSAENLLTICCMWERMKRGRAATLRAVRAAIASPDLNATLKEMALSDNYAISTAAGRLYGRRSNSGAMATSVEDVIETLMMHTAFLNDARIAMDMAGGDAIDFANFHDQITTVYLILPVNQLEKQSRWLRMFIKLALSDLFKEAVKSPPGEQPKLPPVLFMLDEFGNLGHIQEVVRGLNISRDYRVQLWMLMQYENQLREENYPKDFSAFFSGAGAISYFSARDEVTAQSMSKMAGNRQVEMVSRSKNGGSLLTGYLNPKKVSLGESTSMQMFPLLPPEEARRIPPGHTFNLIDPTPMPWLLETPGYWNFPDMVAALDPNPFRHG